MEQNHSLGHLSFISSAIALRLGNRCDKYIIDSYENSFKRKMIFFTIFCVLSGFPLALFPIFPFSLQKDVSHRSLPFHFALSFSIYFMDFIYRPKKHLKLLFLRTFFCVKKIFSSVVFTRERILPCRYDIFLRFFCKSGNFVLMSAAVSSPSIAS